MAQKRKIEDTSVEEVKLQEVEPKESKKVTTPKETKKKEQPVQSSGYVHIDVFLNTARVLFDLSQYQVAGFKAFMAGRLYQKTDADFIPFLEEYLGKEVR